MEPNEPKIMELASPDPVPRLVAYGDVTVVEFDVEGCTVMRRTQDSWVNATQLARLVSVVRPKISGSIEAQAKQGAHEIVQDAPDQLKGVWVSIERAESLCKEYDIYGVLTPLFNYKGPKDLARTTSTLTEADEPASPTKKAKIAPELPSLQTFDHDTQVPNPNAPHALAPLGDDEADEKSKVVLSSLFLPNQKEFSLEGVAIDAPIDDNGQTALHLAATLGRISLVKELVSRGANRLRGDNDGQTALIRAVHATNCLEHSCFDQLLDYLYPAITVLDHKGRSVLHHIAYTCGRKGRNEACNYYLETLLEWVVKRGPHLPPGQQMSLTSFMQEVVNIPDRNGDTCLNIAAMVGNKQIIQQLLEVGADPNKANKAGVKPVDCGIDVASARTRLPQPTAVQSVPETPKLSSMKILESLQTFVSQLGRDFREELESKTKQVDEIHPKLREKTYKLSEKRKQFEELDKLVRKIGDYKTKIINLNNAIREEEQRFVEETKELPINSKTFDGDFDADEPFTVWSVYNEVERRLQETKDPAVSVADFINQLDPATLLASEQLEDLPPAVILEARINAYTKNNAMLIERTKNRRSSSQELEQQFKRVIGLCIGSSVDEIDEKLLGSLLLSVENDPDPEIGQIKKVLSIVNEIEK
ncbi:hypothetical protein KL918_001820 [Ogataea parapolymorpha]|uniref:Start control protein cdc10 n=1 Tax=Ogataea parapolymorpha (strain ATCC 26012 / BCRC 20466 / JCM 22074 / NRRL Y-7560 / DL-1) TaxID=871575 RepID=W1QE11_OGAPD|nr:Start control protein cdc10 [Ogataea parapolymorpha DL-1]ESW98789.1 Start control protein cdc10 [Ogataea parapolymorpha DL-1]KAG7868162.1 hypothetical protein KL918_001820 [Ogataea parapolymorpha]KAG7874218.1 hypothetical protein KL916_001558 [Ogataea parapolymorpha]